LHSRHYSAAITSPQTAPHAKPQRHHAEALACHHRRNNTLTLIIEKRSGHPMLALIPASILNHNSKPKGIPTESINP
jgi:hypothetical protein